MPDYALVATAKFALEDYSLLVLSLVCRRWSDVVRMEEVWEGKVVDFADRRKAIEALRAWYPRLRRATVEMTHAVKDALVDPNQQRHRVAHPWADSPWMCAVLDGKPRLLCLTRCRGPLDAHVYQDLTDREGFSAPILLGWTSATSHRALTRMSERVLTGDTEPSDFIVAISLWPANVYEDFYRVDLGNVVDPPPCFDAGGPWIAQVRLNVEDRSLSLRTPRNEEETLDLVIGERVQNRDELRFFVAVAPAPRRNASTYRAPQYVRLPRVFPGPTPFEPS